MKNERSPPIRLKRLIATSDLIRLNKATWTNLILKILKSDTLDLDVLMIDTIIIVVDIATGTIIEVSGMGLIVTILIGVMEDGAEKDGVALDAADLVTMVVSAEAIELVVIIDYFVSKVLV